MSLCPQNHPRVFTSAFNLTDDVPLPAESPPCSGMWERLELVLRKLNAQAHYASTSSVLVRGHVAVSPNLASSGMAEPLPQSQRAFWEAVPSVTRRVLRVTLHSQSSFNLGMGVSTSAFNVQGVPKCVPAFKLLYPAPVLQ